MKKRIFLAIHIQPQKNMMDVLTQLKKSLQNEQIKWVNNNQFHLTLKFLGDTDESTITRIEDLVEKVCAETTAFSFYLANPGYFRQRNQLRVVLMEILQHEALTRFQQLLDTQIATELGIRQDDRTFKPHLTLGRIKSILDTKHFYESMRVFPKESIQHVQVDNIILYESILKPSGSEYFPLKIFKLQASFSEKDVS